MKKHYNTLYMRIVLLFLATTVLCAFFYCSYLFFNFYVMLKDQTDSTLQLGCNAITNNADVVFDNVNRSATILISDQNVRDALELIQQPDIPFDQEMQARQTLLINAQLSITTNQFFATHFYSTDEQFICATGATVRGPEGDIFCDPEQSITDDTFRYGNAYLYDQYTHAETFVSESAHLMYVRPVRKIYREDPLGYVAYFVDVKEFYNMIAERMAVLDTAQVQQAKITVVNEQQHVLASSVPIEQSTFVAQPHAVRFASEQSKFGYTTYIEVPQNYITRMMFAQLPASLVAPALLILFSSFALFWLLQRSFAQFNALEKYMQKIESGDYTTYITEQTSFSDIQTLYTGFNRMLETINTMIETEYKDKIVLKDTQLQMLKLQMNPHFLFNTLQSIEAMGEIHENYEVCEMASALGELLRYNLRGRDFVPVTAEVQCVHTYLKIQQLRFQDKLTYQIFVDPEIADSEIPQFVLQPLVENCIVHGFQNMRIKGEIQISCTAQGKHIWIKIKDNGIGFAPEKRVLSANFDVIETEHVGLNNVNVRLKKRFGEEFGVFVMPCEQGAEILLKVPRQDGGVLC